MVGGRVGGWEKNKINAILNSVEVKVEVEVGVELGNENKIQQKLVPGDNDEAEDESDKNENYVGKEARCNS